MAPIARTLMPAATVVILLNIHICGATYSCCSEERRGTVCTLAGSGGPHSIDSPNASTAAFISPVAVAVYPPNIIVSGNNEHRLRIIHGNGTVSTLTGGGPTGETAGLYKDSNDPLAARFWAPSGVCTDNEGNVLLCDSYNHRIRTVLRNGSVRTLAGSGETGLSNGGYADSVDPLKARFYAPHSIANIYERGQRLIIIGGNFDHRIRVIYANRTVSTLAGSGPIGDPLGGGFEDSADPLDARFYHPVGVAQDHSGNIIVADHYTGRFRKVWRDGSQSGVTTIAGNGPLGTDGGSSIDSDNPFEASFFTPFGVAIDGAGNIVVSVHREHRVRMIFANGSVRTLAGSGPSIGLSLSTLGGFIDNVPLLQARFNQPTFLTIDRRGSVIVADPNNNRVRMLCTNLPTIPSPSASPSYTRTRVSSQAASTQSRRPATASNTSIPSGSIELSQSEILALSNTHSKPSSSLSLHLLPPSAPNPISHLVSSEEAARAVVASGAAAAALAGFAATASMGHATRMGALMRSVECAFAASDLDPPLARRAAASVEHRVARRLGRIARWQRAPDLGRVSCAAAVDVRSCACDSVILWSV